ncbi:MAG: DUF2185 domain-containing protein [Firmicutes bacterium]|nr:DUF2185 domain-containing protein [Bacillota bacterium]
MFNKKKKPAPDAIQPVLDNLRAFRAEMEAIDWPTGGTLENDRRKFILLLSGLSSCRMAPGIPQNMGHEALFECANEEDRAALRGHLNKLFGITDDASLWDALNDFYRSYDEYDTFRTFWAGCPEFDLDERNKAGRKSFEASMRFAEKLRDITGSNGFLAWDINERIGMCRRAYAAGFITQERFWEATDSMAFRAAAYYDNWGEYALACVCGAVYYCYRQMCDNDEAETAAAPFLGIQLNLARALTAEDGIWRVYGWPKYNRNGKKYHLAAKEIIPMLHGWDGPKGCLATDRITVDGCKVGYMYREAPDYSGDSGWRFFTGDEDDDYANNPDNSGVYDLNTICNDDPGIIPLLRTPAGTAFARDEKGRFREEAFAPGEE